MGFQRKLVIDRRAHQSNTMALRFYRFLQHRNSVSLLLYLAEIGAQFDSEASQTFFWVTEALPYNSKISFMAELTLKKQVTSLTPLCIHSGHFLVGRSYSTKSSFKISHGSSELQIGTKDLTIAKVASEVAKQGITTQ